jgi:large subunit ribosomal protein L10
VNRAEKAESIKELTESFKSAKGIFVADYRGLPVADITALRFELKKNQTDLKVVKNRMALRALDASGDYGAFKTNFDHMTAVALSFGDVSASAKAITKFAKENDKLKIRAGYIEGKVISLADVKALASLPSRNELLAKLLGTFVAVPSGFVRVLNGVPSKWVYLLQALKEKKEKAG